ncbi:acyltransferase family protein [Hymenobacter arizonensis]|uniref:Peptidoglycan/LPS O-acetylase OafA/YrhL, contains acyltransferase and SGNH-hydrolase domains n=1 Tax=Hymenobacter arizonensis TaxID=1227077 RepID=A0A1I5ZU53_HYMAR|nr:acyltransferase [Hymenobacter arizonensis]SFQ59955.1 Peptidoglycan/LPS O-acetylase OafA/YrhL, contains acyltransferase and SGNH-hydrolase domains [Hymenobacter arizonensis]
MEALYPSENGYQNNFDFSRVVLATIVVFCHSYVIYDGSLLREPLWRLSNHQLTLGTFAINFFFVISGFLISQSWDRSRSFNSYFKKRALRIYPGFIFVCLACAFLFAPLGRTAPTTIAEYWSSIDFKHLALRTLTLREPILPETYKTLPYPGSINGSLWSISYEFICYILIPVCALLGIFQQRGRVLLIFLVVLLINIVDYKAYHLGGANTPFGFSLLPQFIQAHSNKWLTLTHLLLPFVGGMCFYTYRQYVPRSIYLVALSAVVLVLTLRWFNFFEVAQSVFGAYVLFYFVFNEKVRLHHFAKYGDFSYGIYLYGWPVQQLVMLYAGHRIGVHGLFLVSMVIVMPCAAISWFLIEKPFLRLNAKPAAPSPALVAH